MVVKEIPIEYYKEELECLKDNIDILATAMHKAENLPKDLELDAAGLLRTFLLIKEAVEKALQTGRYKNDDAIYKAIQVLPLFYLHIPKITNAIQEVKRSAA